MSEPDYIEQTVKDVFAAIGQESKMGRPTAITPEVIRTLADALAGGASPSDASAEAGISYRTFQRWMEAGRADETCSTPEYHFCRGMHRARLRLKQAKLAHLKSTEDDPRLWAASATALERLFPEEWARRSPENAAQNGVKVEVLIGIAPPGTPQNPIAVGVRALSPHTETPSALSLEAGAAVSVDKA